MQPVLREQEPEDAPEPGEKPVEDGERLAEAPPPLGAWPQSRLDGLPWGALGDAHQDGEAEQAGRREIVP